MQLTAGIAQTWQLPGVVEGSSFPLQSVQVEPESTLAPFISFNEGLSQISFDNSEESIGVLAGNSYYIVIKLINTEGYVL